MRILLVDYLLILMKIKYQYGTEGHSTTHALVKLTDGLKNSNDNGNYACGFFFDLKAFEELIKLIFNSILIILNYMKN